MGVRNSRFEGSGSSKLVKLIREIGYNNDLDIILATVKSPPPNIVIRLNNMNGIELGVDDLTILDYLNQHKVTMQPEGTTDDQTYIVKSPLQEGNRVVLLVKEERGFVDNFYVIGKL